MERKSIDIAFVSEASVPYRSPMALLPGFVWASPLGGRKGGAGFIFRQPLLGDAKVKIRQDTARFWSIATFASPCGALFSAIYITPDGHTTPGVTEAFLETLTGHVQPGTPCFVGGDFNAATGSRQRLLVDAWAVSCGMRLVNGGMPTYWQRAGSIGTDLDLAFVRGRQATVLPSERPETGHKWVQLKLESVANRYITPDTPKIAWPKLIERGQAFIDSVEAQLRASPETSVNSAILTAAESILGYLPPRCVRLPSRVRQKIRRLRALAKNHPRGSDRHTAALRELSEIFQFFRVKEWRKKISRLADEPGVSIEAWQIARRLGTNPTATRNVGIPDAEVAKAHAEVYSSNKVRRPDWVSAKPASCNCTRDPHMDVPFSPNEVSDALRSLPNRKAPGLDGIPHEAYKILQRGDLAVRTIARQINGYLQHGYTPVTPSRLVVIPKKGIPKNPLDMRPLMMLPTERKLLEQLLAQRIKNFGRRRGWDGMYFLQGGFRHRMNIERQILLADLACTDALCNGRELRIVALDLVKAFDRLPKEFAAHCAANLLGPTCPVFTRLVTEVARSQVVAHLGIHRFTVETGVPQGGILSPWLFICAMNDLAVRLKDAGFHLTGGAFVGSLLYADDILLLDRSASDSDSRCRIVQDWVHEWGGQLNAAKTQWLTINPSSDRAGPTIEGSLPSNGDESVDYLGSLITQHGVKLKYSSGEFAVALQKCSALTRLDGLPPTQCLQMIRAIAWPRISLGMNVVAPDPAHFVRKWHEVARGILATYNSVHGAEMQRELGYLYHPLWWMIKALVTFYSTWFKMQRDPHVSGILKSLPADHPLRIRVSSLLRPSGISWEELESGLTPDLVRRAQGTIREFSRRQILEEARRLEIYDPCDPVWSEDRDEPALYLREENGRYGFIFRLHSLGPGDHEVSPCSFCSLPHGDHGKHVLLECAAARVKAPLPPELAKLSPASLAQALRLADSTTVERRRTVLTYCKTLWAERRTLNTTFLPPAAAPTFNRSNRFFFSSTPGEAPPRGPRPLAENMAPEEDEPIPSGELRSLQRPRTGKWIQIEDKLLLKGLRTLDRSDLRGLSAYVGSRTPAQVSMRLKAKYFSRLESAQSPRGIPDETAAEAPPEPPAAAGPETPEPSDPRNGPWSLTDTTRLATAARAFGCDNPLLLQAAAPRRTPLQIKRHLLSQKFLRILGTLQSAPTSAAFTMASDLLSEMIEAVFTGKSAARDAGPAAAERLAEELEEGDPGSGDAWGPTCGEAEEGRVTADGADGVPEGATAVEARLTPPALRKGAWSTAESTRLADALALGLDITDAARLGVLTRTPAQCKEHSQTNIFRALAHRLEEAATRAALSPAPKRPRNRQPNPTRSAERSHFTVDQQASNLVPPSSPAEQGKRAERSRWTPEEDARLLAAYRELGRGYNQEFSARVGTKTALQCSDRLRTRTIQTALTATPTATRGRRTTAGLESGHWSTEEFNRLLEAYNSRADGRITPAVIQPFIPSRSLDQIARVIDRLAATGVLTYDPGTGRWIFNRHPRSRSRSRFRDE
jgi:hypothetical protein